MLGTELERLARLEEQVRGVRKDVNELTSETQRARKRLHDLEGIAGALADANTARHHEAVKRDKRMGIRIQALTAVVAGAALFEPFLYHFATGK